MKPSSSRPSALKANCRRGREKSRRDRLSELPDDILDHILSFMLLRCAVRTSILSRRWRNLWTCTPSLDFFPEIQENGVIDTISVNTINRCLRLHHGNKLRSFRVCGLNRRYTVKYVKKWIQFARDHGVEELHLSRCRVREFPHSIFDCQTISKLKLECGVLNLPTNFSGLKSLATISLESVMVGNEVIRTLLSACDLLRNLDFHNCYVDKQVEISSAKLRMIRLVFGYLNRNNRVEIDAPSLSSFEYEGCPLNVSQRNLPSLSRANIRIRSFPSLESRTALASDISQVQMLVADDWLFQNLSSAEHLQFENGEEHLLPQYECILFRNLKELHGFVRLYDKDFPLTLINLLSICPILERLCFVNLTDSDCFNQSIEEKWQKLVNDPNPSLRRLKTVKLMGFSGTRAQLLLVNYILKKAVSLDSLLLIHPIKHKKDGNGRTLRNELYQLHKAYPHVRMMASEFSMNHVCPTHICS